MGAKQQQRSHGIRLLYVFSRDKPYAQKWAIFLSPHVPPEPDTASLHGELIPHNAYPMAHLMVLCPACWPDHHHFLRCHESPVDLALKYQHRPPAFAALSSMSDSPSKRHRHSSAYPSSNKGASHSFSYPKAPAADRSHPHCIAPHASMPPALRLGPYLSAA